MSWLERVRQKNYTPPTHGSDKSAKSTEEDQKKFIPLPHGSDKSDKSREVNTSVTFGTGLGEGHEVFSEPDHQLTEVVTVTYQKLSYDWAIADGTYTPEQLRRARKVVKPGPELWYRLRWPGGTPEPITDNARAERGIGRVSSGEGAS
jgi:hypothetical protein